MALDSVQHITKRVVDMTVSTKKTTVHKSTAGEKETPEVAVVEAAETENVNAAPMNDTLVNVAPVKVETVKVVRRKELVERIAARSGVKPNLIKSVLDAVLMEIGDALSGNEALQVQPLGKLSVKRRKDLPDGEVLNCKLRRKTQVETSPAEAAE